MSKLIWVAAVLDVVLNWKARQCMNPYVKLRYLLKVVSAAVWVVILTVTWSCSPSLLSLAVVVYLLPNMLAAVLFLFPFIRSYLENSGHRLVMLMMWWFQVNVRQLFSFHPFICDEVVYNLMICLMKC